jgi:hypothetical protein
MGTATSLEHLAQTFDGLFTHRVYRLETLDYYDAPNEREAYTAFRAGDRVDPAWRDGWKRIVQGIRQSGREMARVHIVSEPASDYVRFTLLHGYPTNVEAGEDVRVLGRTAARDAGLPDVDYWLFDDRLAAVLAYDVNGAVQQVRWCSRSEDRGFLEDCCRWRDTALREAVPLARYVATHKIHQRKDGSMSSEWDGARFFKAEDSNDYGCVEVAFHNGKIGVRDSKDHGTGPVLGFTEHEWACFVQGAKNGEFDLPQ